MTITNKQITLREQIKKVGDDIYKINIMPYSRSSKQAAPRCRKSLSVLLTLGLILSSPAIPASANNSVYEGAYNIHHAIEYAEQYAGGFNSDYEIAYAVIETSNGKRAREEDCTNFTSQCLTAGGIPTTEGWNGNSKGLFPKDYPDYYDSTKSHTIYRGYSDGYNTFVNAGLFNQYFANQGYLVEKSVNTDENTLTISNLRPAAGDIVQFDWNGDGIIDHSMICCGFTENGEPCLAGHSTPAFMKPFSQIQSTQVFTYLPAENYTSGTVIYLIHMTDTTGLTDVTRHYQNGQIVAIRSLEVGQYVSVDTDQREDSVNSVANRTTAGTWELFKIEKNRYGEVGFRSLSNGNYLSARVDLDAESAPIQAAYGWDYAEPLAWESFRIYEKDGIHYLQSQGNGKFVQVSADEDSHQIRACARAASTWERFSLEIVPAPVADSTVNHGNTVSSVPSDTTVLSTAAQPAANWVDQMYYGSGYNEVIYTGELSNGKPNGWGKLEYKDNNGDGLFYTLTFDTESYRAEYYEGYFKDGFRYGQGTVEYEGGYSTVGTYYGAWQAGKTVFEGTLHYPDGSFWDCSMVCITDKTAEWLPR